MGSTDIGKIAYVTCLLGASLFTFFIMNVIRFSRWREVLATSNLEAKLIKEYTTTLKWYLNWCYRNRCPCTIESARSFVTWATESKNPSSDDLALWKDGLNWFFHYGKSYGECLKSSEEIYDFDAFYLPDTDQERMSPQSSEEEMILATMRHKGLALRTERTYLSWYRDYLQFFKNSDDASLSASRVKSYLDFLAMQRAVAASTQKQALNALVFVANAVQADLGEIGDYCKAHNRRRVPVVMSQKEIRRFFDELLDKKLLMAQLQYGAALRVSELLRLRVKDIDIERNQLTVRGGKGDRDRIAPLPEVIVPELTIQLKRLKKLFESDRENNFPGVYLPPALSRKYPKAGMEWQWQWFWPSRQLSVDPRSGIRRRHHVLETVYQSAVKKAAKDAGLNKRVTTHVLRHSAATHLLENGVDIRTVQDLLGHKSVETTQIYLHVMQKNEAGLKSPLDSLST